VFLPTLRFLACFSAFSLFGYHVFSFFWRTGISFISCCGFYSRIDDTLSIDWRLFIVLHAYETSGCLFVHDERPRFVCDLRVCAFVPRISLRHVLTFSDMSSLFFLTEPFFFFLFFISPFLSPSSFNRRFLDFLFFLWFLHHCIQGRDGGMFYPGYLWLSCVLCL